MTEPQDIAADLKSGLRLLTRATIVLYLMIMVGVVFERQDSAARRAELARDARRTGAALCALRADLEKRVAVSQSFLDANPAGIPGIPAATLRQSISNQQGTVDALAGLRC